jgi:hypothetical protein
MGSMLALGVALLALAGPAGAPDERARLERAQARWSRQHLRDYRYRLEVGCFCPEQVRGPHTLTVRDGRPVRPRRFTASYDTVPELFGVVDDAIDGRVASLTVRYDRRRGFPRTISVDGRRNVADDEITISVDRFRRLR